MSFATPSYSRSSAPVSARTSVVSSCPTPSVRTASASNVRPTRTAPRVRAHPTQAPASVPSPALRSSLAPIAGTASPLRERPMAKASVALPFRPSAAPAARMRTAARTSRKSRDVSTTTEREASVRTSATPTTSAPRATRASSERPSRAATSAPARGSRTRGARPSAPATPTSHRSKNRPFVEPGTTSAPAQASASATTVSGLPAAPRPHHSTSPTDSTTTATATPTI